MTKNGYRLSASLIESVNAGYRVTLASSSPRRRELLEESGLRFRVHSPGSDECVRADHLIEDLKTTVDGKLQTVPQEDGNGLVIAADTVVVCGRGIFGKPENEEAAAEQLRSLSGRAHRVLTCVMVQCRTGIQCRATSGRYRLDSIVESTVRFRKLDEGDIWKYISTGSPMDKAGSYGIQDEQHDFVTGIDGSVSNVMGLPLEELARMLEEIGRL